MDHSKTANVDGAVPAAVSAGTVELRVPLDTGLLFLVRMVAEGIAVRAKLDLDEIADLRMAVDEGAGCLFPRARPGTQLWCRFEESGRSVTVQLTATTTSATTPGTGGFEWHVLRTLTDALTTWIEPGPADEAVDTWFLHLRFTKRSWTGGP
ncbi:anti-sigma factor [Amycolatopsis sp. NPDC059021]|uniref:anti-sigma factor n=1 Tax=Amycolatopsis sp. NPDC059021 TaxID=3346704 RepID=UPI00366F7945